MSWLFSRALAVEYLGEISSDGEQSAQLSVMPSPHKFWRNDKTMEFSALSQFGLTLEVLTEVRGEELLTSYLAAFPARTFLRPVMERESTDREAGFGQKGRESFATFDHSSFSWKTRQCSLLGGFIEFLETWPKWGSMLNGAVYRRKTPSGLMELRSWITSEKEFGSSVTAPTPTVKGNYNRKGLSKKSGDGLATFVMRVPTPRHQDGKHAGVSRTETVNRRVLKGQANLAEFVLTVPTPTKTDSTKWNNKTAEQRRKQGSSVRIGNVVTKEDGTPAGGSLNPDWVEWLMGWPIGWTALEALEMDRFQQWLRSHGGC